MRRRFSISLFILLNLLPLFPSPVSYSQLRKVDLTGNWVGKAQSWKFILDDTGCNVDYSGKIEVKVKTQITKLDLKLPKKGIG